MERVLNLRFLLLLTAYTARAADLKYMKTTIENHFSNTRHHGTQWNIYKSQTKGYIHDEFTKFDLDVTYHTFIHNIGGEEFTFHTVIGILKGERFGSAEDIIVGLGAHYDSVSDTKGVDDNGSGVAALLEVARTLTDANKKGATRKNTVIFVSFDLEELGLTGSNKFVFEWLPQWLNTSYSATPRTHGIIILDTIMEYNSTNASQTFPPGAENEFPQVFPASYSSVISDGSRGDFLLLIYRQPTNDSILAETFKNSWVSAKRKEFEIESFPLPFDDIYSLPSSQQQKFYPFLRSDHANFWDGGYPAIFLTDSANYRGDMIYCYHNPCDDLDTMLTDDNLEFLGKTTDALIDTINTMSEPSDYISHASDVEVHLAWTLIIAIVAQCITNGMFI